MQTERNGYLTKAKTDIDPRIGLVFGRGVVQIGGVDVEVNNTESGVAIKAGSYVLLEKCGDAFVVVGEEVVDAD